MLKEQKRVVAIHDISCVGKCSLTVALPILSAAGVETSIIPTAVLSTHTGGFTGYTYRDLTDEILPITDHWKTLDLKIDAIYTGFLGSFEQIDIMKKVFDTFKTKDNLIYVDPVMGDNGALYTIFDQEFAKGMASLCAKADIIIPNITEACFMLEETYLDPPYEKSYVEKLLKQLAALGPKKVVLTGVAFNEENLGTAVYDSEKGAIDYIFAKRIEGYYHGTGDVFGSALLAGLMNGCSLKRSAEVAVNYTVGSIQRTKDAETDVKYGVDFERGVPDLIKDLKL
ncbi:MAG: pyridoxamine kinase [Bacillota bacterium]|nr:pyridoxamine kinase [Bacillota bacterium]